MANDYIRVFRAFTDENRIQILELLCDGEQCACVLLENLKISQPTLSHHMKILCESGIVNKRKVGPWNYYSIDQDGCDHAFALLGGVADKKLKKTLEISRAIYRGLRIFVKKSPEKEIEKCRCESGALASGNVERIV